MPSPTPRRSTKIRIAATLAIAATALGGAVAPAAVAAPNTLTVFDIAAFIATQPSTKLGYDYLKLATALQGVVNREEARLFLLGDASYVAKAEGFAPDPFWLEQLSKPGEHLAGRTVVEEDSFDGLLDAFAGDFDGVVVWDQRVPATANLASTAAGVENLLPVRFDPTPGSPYSELVTERGLAVELDLVGMFTGEGVIPGTDTPSTGSAKNDAYRWAKQRWLDTGKTNPKLMLNALDAVSWSPAESALTRASIPAKLQVGQQLPVSLEYANNTTATWSRGTLDRVGSSTGNQFTWADLNGGYSQSPDNQRVFLDAGAEIAPGQSVTVDFAIVAPAQPGRYTFSVGIVRDGVTWYADTIYTTTIEVTAEAQPTEPAAPVVPSFEPAYPDLFNTGVYNADYYIAERAFFFDLSADATSIPNDDPGQELGTDAETLISLLRAQNELAGDQVTTVGGFVPWFLKYTNHIDPNASLTPVQMEWLYADVISGYLMQKDADAFGLVGLANASLYRNVALAESFQQLNDAGASGPGYDAGTDYVTFYMGDYDSAAWTAGTLPALWDDPARGQLPLAWPPNASLSDRVPQVFNYLYATQTTSDYFVGGDNGVGYLNPMKLLEGNRPDGLPGALQTWADYNAELYQRFDISLTGFLISGNSGVVPLEVQQAYAGFSPDGVGTNAGFAEPIVDGAAFQTVRDFPIETTDPAVYGEQLAAILRGAGQFHMLRDILITPTLLLDSVNYVRATYPDLDFEVVDPYTSFKLYAEARPWEQKLPTLVTDRADTAPVIDGTAGEQEWPAEGLTISTQDETVQQYGRVWGSIGGTDDLEARYRVTWDDEHLYLMESRSDDAAVFNATDPAIYSSDSSMFFLDLLDRPDGSAYKDGDYAILVTADSPSGSPLIFLREGRDAGSVERELAATVATTRTDEGYTLEIAVPWSELQVTPFAPADGTTVGFSALAIDGDAGGDWGQAIWVGEGDNQAAWGNLRFAGAEQPVDLTELRELIAQATAADPVRWTEGSFATLTDALEAAVAVAGDEDATAAEVAAASADLKAALDQLEPAVSDWSATTVYNDGDLVSHDDRVFEAQWWTKGDEPGSTSTGSWMEYGTLALCEAGSAREWTSSWVYQAKDKAVLDGVVYQAKWWTRNQRPSAEPGTPWSPAGDCQAG